MDMRQVDIRLSDHGGWLARITDAEGMTVVAQRMPTLGRALSWVHTLASAEQLYVSMDKRETH